MNLKPETIEAIKKDTALLEDLMKSQAAWVKLNSELDSPLLFAVILDGVKSGVEWILQHPEILALEGCHKTEWVIIESKDNYYPCECDVCGWSGSSEYLLGGGQIADTGDYDDTYCPCCGNKSVDDIDNMIDIDELNKRYKKLITHCKTLYERTEQLESENYFLKLPLLPPAPNQNTNQ